MDTKGKSALVTGSARRVGRAIALALAERGCDVAVHFRDSVEDAKQTAADVRAFGVRAVLVRADLADDDAPSRVVGETVRQLGRLDVLVNSASVFIQTPLERIDADAFRKVFAINTIAPVLLAKAAWPHFTSAGAGKVVNLTDISADRPWPAHLAYCASKAALVNLTRSLARAMAPAVQVNGVAPGAAVFPEEYDEAKRQAIIARIPLGRAGTPADVAAAVRFLIEDADYVTGAIIPVDGGRSAR